MFADGNSSLKSLDSTDPVRQIEEIKDFAVHLTDNVQMINFQHKQKYNVAILFVWSGYFWPLSGLVWKFADVLRHIYAEMQKIITWGEH